MLLRKKKESLSYLVLNLCIFCNLGPLSLFFPNFLFYTYLIVACLVLFYLN